MVSQNPTRELVLENDRPFGIRRVRNHTVTVGGKGITNIVTVDRITLAKIQEGSRPVTKIERHDDVPSESDDTKYAYDVKGIVRHKDDGENPKYLVKWNGFKFAGYKGDPSHYIPQHFIRRYWKRQRRAVKRYGSVRSMGYARHHESQKK